MSTFKQHSCFHGLKEESLKHDKCPSFHDTKIFKGNPKGPIRNMLVYPELMTTPLNTTTLEVLIAIF